MSYKFLILLIPVILIAACSSNSNTTDNLLLVEIVDTSTFKEYNVITATLNNSKIRIISKKELLNFCNIEIQRYSYYKLSLDKIDYSIYPTTHIQEYEGNVVIEYGSPNDSTVDIVYAKSKLVGNLYSSPDLKGICITNPNIFHYP